MRMVVAMWVVAWALTGCERSTRPSDEKPGPVALVLAEDGFGERAVFQLAPDGCVPVAVGGFDKVRVQSAAAAASGKASAYLVTTAGGEQQLWRGPSERVPDAPGHMVAVRGVSDDGAVIVVEVASSELVAVGRGTTIDSAKLGRLMYGVALSPDGTKLAFSTMQKSCAGNSELMGSCPVTLYGVDLDQDAPKPRKLAGGDPDVAYDPQFVDRSGSELIFMTNSADQSPACREHVNQCRYEVRRMPFAGGAAKTIERDGVLARVAGDGALSFRRRQLPAWFGQTLYVGDQPVVRDTVDLWPQHWSPDARWIALHTHREEQSFLEIVDRGGSGSCPPVASDDGRVIGWSARPLPPGARQLAEPARARGLRQALERARAEPSPVATFHVSDFAYGRAGEGVARMRETAELDGWLGEPGALVIAERDELCQVRRSLKHPVALVDRFGGDLLLVRQGTSVVAVSPSTPVLAHFSFPDGGAIDLIGVDMPASVRAGEVFDMTLRWRVVSELARRWKVFVHLDGAGTRVNADHAPGMCHVTDHTAGEVIEDTFEVEVSSPPSSVALGRYRLHVGWFEYGARARASSETLPVADDRVEVGSLEITDRLDRARPTR